MRNRHARVHDSPKVTRPLIRQRSLVSVVVSEVGPPQDQFAAEHAHRGEPTTTQRGELGVGAKWHPVAPITWPTGRGRQLLVDFVRSRPTLETDARLVLVCQRQTRVLNALQPSS